VFKPRSSTHRYHSDECKHGDIYGERKCECCGQAFVPTSARQRFVDRTHYRQWMKGRSAMFSQTINPRKSWKGAVTMRLSEKSLATWEFKRDPFADEPRSVAELFWSAEHKKLHDHLLNVISNNDAVAVSAPVGWGKTIMRMALVDELTQDEAVGYLVCQVRSINKKGISPTTIQKALLRDLEQDPTGQMDSESLTMLVETVMKARTQRRKRIVLLIDEAHLLADESFRALKNLLDIKDGFRRVMSIILLGQEELSPTLARNALREVGARIECVKPGPLSIPDGELRAYVRNRIAVARLDREPLGDEADTIAVPFDESGLIAVEQEAQGLGETGEDVAVRPDILTINAICSHSLHYAADLGIDVVNDDVVRKARARMLAGV